MSNKCNVEYWQQFKILIKHVKCAFVSSVGYLKCFRHFRLLKKKIQNTKKKKEKKNTNTKYKIQKTKQNKTKKLIEEGY